MSAQAAEVVEAPDLATALAMPVDTVVAFIDADGNRRDPSAAEVEALMQSARALPTTGHLPKVRTFMMKDGTIAAKLPPEYMMKRVVRRGEDGKLHYSHTNGVELQHSHTGEANPHQADTALGEND